MILPFLFFLVILFSADAKAQTLCMDDDVMHWEAGFNAGLNNDGYEFDFRGLYFPIQYVGLKIGLGLASEIEAMEDWWAEDWEKSTDYTVRFKFNPAIVLRTPRLIRWKGQDGGFYLYTEPGITLSPGAVGSWRARFLNWDLKSGINLQIDRFIFTIGYGISDFSLYSGAPVNHHGLPVDTDYITHTLFIGGSMKF